MDLRKRIRQKVLSQRNKLSFENQEKKSKTISEKILSLDQVVTSEVIFCYVSYKSEVNTKKIIARLIELGKTVAVPLTLEKEKKLLAVCITDIDKDLTPGYCAIPEPKKELLAKHCINPAKIDTIIIPGSVFDLGCGRMGYGGGFYDRFIAYQSPEALRIGVCFETQIVEELKLEAHDKRMDIIVSEKRFLKRK